MHVTHKNSTSTHTHTPICNTAEQQIFVMLNQSNKLHKCPDDFVNKSCLRPDQIYEYTWSMKLSLVNFVSDTRLKISEKLVKIA